MLLIKQNGGNLIRTIMYPNATEIEWEHAGNYTDRLNIAQEMDDILDYAEQLGLYIDWNMQIHYSFNTHDFSYGTNWSWDADAFNFAPSINDTSNRENYKPYCYKTIVGNDPLGFYTNQEAKKYYKQRIRYILSRWGYSPNIAFFELISEISNTGCKIPECNPGDGEGGGRYDENTIPIYKNWQTEMAAYIKSFYYGKKHPLGSGYTSKLTDFVNTDDTYKDSNFDLICYTRYDYSEPSFGEEILKMTQEITGLTKDNIKPVIFSETDVQDARCDAHVVEMRRQLWQLLFSGAAGAFSWNMSLIPQLYPTLGQMQNVLDKFNLDFEKDGWHPGSCKLGSDEETWTFIPHLKKDMSADLSDFIYLREKNGHFGIGVASNKTFSIHNQGEDCFKPWWNNCSECYKKESSYEKEFKDYINKKHILFPQLWFANLSKGRFKTEYYTVSNLSDNYAHYNHNYGKRFELFVLTGKRLKAEFDKYITLVVTHHKDFDWNNTNGYLLSNEIPEPPQFLEVFDEADAIQKLDVSYDELSKGIEIYPNPFDNQLTVNIRMKDVLVSFLTLEGKLIKKIRLLDDSSIIDTRDLPYGFYLIQLSNNVQILTVCKFLKL